MVTQKKKHAGGRPLTYNSQVVDKVREYIDSCEDEVDEFHKTRGEKSDSYERIINVRIPTIEGLAEVLDVRRETLYDWETKYPEFSNILNLLREKQARMLIQKGLSGQYNPTIAKVLLTKHGYREGVDQTTNGKDLPTPIYGGQSTV